MRASSPFHRVFLNDQDGSDSSGTMAFANRCLNNCDSYQALRTGFVLEVRQVSREQP
jgi:hypothetical protein